MKTILRFLLGVGLTLASQAQTITESTSAQPDDVAATQIDSLFKSRKFEEALPAITNFLQTYPDSPQASAVAEIQLATLFERGQKKVAESSLIKDDINRANARLEDGRGNLEQFISLAASLTNYSVVPKHNLREDIWLARLTLGDGEAALKEIADDAAARERFGFLRIRLSQKLHSEVETNLQLMADFIQQFPDSTNRNRVEFDMANISFPRGKQLVTEADAAEKAGDADTATQKRALASRYFEIQRSVQSRAVVDKNSDIEISDIFDLAEDRLFACYLVKDYNALASLTASMISESKEGDLNSTLAKFFDGVALLNQSSDKTGDAEKIFDTIFALGFRGKPDHDHLVMAAAKWRIFIALNAGDRKKAEQVIQSVMEAGCTKDLKAAFLKDHASLVGLQILNSK